MFPPHEPRRGPTLPELLISIAITTLLAGVLAMLVHGVRIAAEHNHGQGLAAQHVRVALDRIARTISEAYATEDHFGAVAIDPVTGLTSIGTIQGSAPSWATDAAALDPQSKRTPGERKHHRELAAHEPMRRTDWGRPGPRVRQALAVRR